MRAGPDRADDAQIGRQAGKEVRVEDIVGDLEASGDRVEIGEVVLVGAAQDGVDVGFAWRVIVDRHREIAGDSITIEVAGRELEGEVDIVFGVGDRVVEHVEKIEGVAARAVVAQRNDEDRAILRPDSLRRQFIAFATLATVGVPGADIADDLGAGVIETEVHIMAARREHGHGQGLCDRLLAALLFGSVFGGEDHADVGTAEIDSATGEFGIVGRTGIGAILYAVGIIDIPAIGAPEDIQLAGEALGPRAVAGAALLAAFEGVLIDVPVLGVVPGELAALTAVEPRAVVFDTDAERATHRDRVGAEIGHCEGKGQREQRVLSRGNVIERGEYLHIPGAGRRIDRRFDGRPAQARDCADDRIRAGKAPDDRFAARREDTRRKANCERHRFVDRNLSLGPRGVGAVRTIALRKAVISDQSLGSANNLGRLVGVDLVTQIAGGESEAGVSQQVVLAETVADTLLAEINEAAMCAVGATLRSRCRFDPRRLEHQFDRFGRDLDVADEEDEVGDGAAGDDDDGTVGLDELEVGAVGADVGDVSVGGEAGDGAVLERDGDYHRRRAGRVLRHLADIGIAGGRRRSRGENAFVGGVHRHRNLTVNAQIIADGHN